MYTNFAKPRNKISLKMQVFLNPWNMVPTKNNWIYSSVSYIFMTTISKDSHVLQYTLKIVSQCYQSLHVGHYLFALSRKDEIGLTDSTQ